MIRCSLSDRGGPFWTGRMSRVVPGDRHRTSCTRDGLDGYTITYVGLDVRKLPLRRRGRRSACACRE